MHNKEKGGAPILNEGDYRRFGEFLRATCGIDLGANKQYLVSTRVRRILLDHGLNSLGELIERIRHGHNRLLRQEVIDAMTTNETFWFRDGYPYSYLINTLLPERAREKPGSQTIRIWSAACSTGQEPYSISMAVEECMRGRFGQQAIEAKIIATDVSNSVLMTAKKGHYDRLSLMRGLSADRTKKFFTQTTEDTWAIKESVQARVRFRQLNLKESYALLGKFDIVFCRNVLIYFSSDLKQEILTKIHSVLNPGGILVLGSSEGITGLSSLYEMINCDPGVAYRARAPS